MARRLIMLSTPQRLDTAIYAEVSIRRLSVILSIVNSSLSTRDSSIDADAGSTKLNMDAFSGS